MPDTSDGMAIVAFVLVALALAALTGSALLARKALRDGRGDRRGAARMAAGMTIVLLAVWACQVHLVASAGFLASLLLAICTSVFYGTLVWTFYMGLEPIVRRGWPHVLVSWTTVLTGRIRDRVVGRDVLFGAAVGGAWVLLIRVAERLEAPGLPTDVSGSMALLGSLRATLGEVLEQAPYSLRNALLYFLLLFAFRAVLRREAAAALAFGLFFAGLNLLGNDGNRLLDATVAALYFGSGALLVLRRGLLAYLSAIFVASVTLVAPATRDPSTWYFANTALTLSVPLLLATWALTTAIAAPARRAAVP
jgi:hypothetical protein